MALRLQGWKRRFFGLGTGLLLCASIGCGSTKEARGPVINVPTKPMGPGNQVMNPPTSPVYNNLAGANPGGSTVYQNSPPHVNAPAANPAVGNRGFQHQPMSNVQMPVVAPGNQPTTQPVYIPDGQVMPQGYYPANPQGLQPVQGPALPVQNPQTMAPAQQPVNSQNSPQNLPPVNPLPISMNNSMSELKLPDHLTAPVTGVDAKVLPGGSKLMQVSGTTSEPNLALDPPPSDRKASVKVTDITPRKIVAPIEEVEPAPITVGVTNLSK